LECFTTHRSTNFIVNKQATFMVVVVVAVFL
jgi:hypothetical protein